MESISTLASHNGALLGKYSQRYRHSNRPRTATLAVRKSENGPSGNGQQDYATATHRARQSCPSWNSVSSAMPQKPVEVERPYLSRVAVAICNAVDDFINDILDKRPLRPWIDPRLVLAGNSAPVPEVGPTECLRVEGVVPECVEGVYIRNGPNPRYVPRAGHHLLDGDGMLHALTIKDGRATFCSRFVRTEKFIQEEIAGRPIFPNIFSGFYGVAGLVRVALVIARIALGQINVAHGAGLANTSVFLFDNKLMALGESGLPYLFRMSEDGDVENVGKYDFNGKLCMRMTAHPKIDPDTGEMFAFRYAAVSPCLNFFRVASTGEKEADVGIGSLRQPSLIHDFAITKKYAIFPDTQIVASPMNMVFGDGSPIGYDASKVPRLGVIPRYATDDKAMKWFDVPGCNFLHFLNAWDAGNDQIALIACNSSPIEHILERIHLVHFSVEQIRVNLRTGEVSREILSSESLELGVINPRFLTKKNRYAYMSIAGTVMPKNKGIVKLDLDAEESRVAGCRVYDEGCFGSEPFFVARSWDADEDDGYIVAYTHNESSGISSFVVMDAQSPTLDIVASIELPQRVPYGFHGLFVSHKDLANITSL
eukprot:Gb_04986 [translate_table: standard]